MGRRKGECHTPWCRELGQVSRCKICTLRHFLFSCWMNMFDLLCTLPHTPPRGVNLINLSKNWTRLIFNFQHEVGRRGGELEWNVFYPEIKNWIYLNNYPTRWPITFHSLFFRTWFKCYTYFDKFPFESGSWWVAIFYRRRRDRNTSRFTKFIAVIE